MAKKIRKQIDKVITVTVTSASNTEYERKVKTYVVYKEA
jgi:hypothetical protein